MDECAEFQTVDCQFSCRNTFGSFHCVCPNGYTLSPDKTTCIGRRTLLVILYIFLISIYLLETVTKIIIFFFIEEEHVQCLPGCLNGGKCRAGKCRCPLGFSGAFCQDGINSYCSVFDYECIKYQHSSCHTFCSN